MTTVTQVGPLFYLGWTLDTPEEVELRRTVPAPAVLVATLPAGITE